MDPRIKSTGKNSTVSKRKGSEPNGSIHSGTVAKAAHTHTPAQRIDEQSSSVTMISLPQQPSPNHLPPTYRSQQRAPPASRPHHPSSHATVEEIDVPAPGGAYVPPLSAREMDYHRVTKSLKDAAYPAAIDRHNTPPPQPQPAYLPQATAYPSVDVLPPTGGYPPMQQPPSRQPPLYQPHVQPPSIQPPMYSNNGYTMYPPPSQSTYQPQHWASAVASLPTAEQYFSALQIPVESSWSGFPGLPRRQNNVSEATARSSPPLHGPSLADTTRKLDAILGKRADQRTEDENRFREEHLATRQNVHTRDAADRKRRRLRDQEKVSSRTEESP
jgi:hypothetical protein